MSMYTANVIIVKIKINYEFVIIILIVANTFYYIEIIMYKKRRYNKL